MKLEDFIKHCAEDCVNSEQPSSALPDSETPPISTSDPVAEQIAEIHGRRHEYRSDVDGELRVTLLRSDYNALYTLALFPPPESAGSGAASDDASEGPPAAELQERIDNLLARLDEIGREGGWEQHDIALLAAAILNPSPPLPCSRRRDSRSAAAGRHGGLPEDRA